MPSLCANCSSTINVTVSFVPGPSNNQRGSCGTVTPSLIQLADGSQRISGGVIKIFERERDSGLSCTPYADRVAHELGHLLGLADATGSSCNGRIMGSRVNGQNRSVTDADCQISREFWRTPVENLPGPPGDGDHGPCGI
jgi:hypothetical protein